MRRSRWLGTGVGAAVLLLAAASTFHVRPELQVETADVTDGPITRRILATGTVKRR